MVMVECNETSYPTRCDYTRHAPFQCLKDVTSHDAVPDQVSIPMQTPAAYTLTLFDTLLCPSRSVIMGIEKRAKQLDKECEGWDFPAGNDHVIDYRTQGGKSLVQVKSPIHLNVIPLPLA